MIRYKIEIEFKVLRLIIKMFLQKLNELDDKYPHTYLALYSCFLVAYLAVTFNSGAEPLANERLFAVANNLGSTLGVSYFYSRLVRGERPSAVCPETSLFCLGNFWTWLGALGTKTVFTNTPLGVFNLVNGVVAFLLTPMVVPRLLDRFNSAQVEDQEM
jgi:hypothetical protein